MSANTMSRRRGKPTYTDDDTKLSRAKFSPDSFNVAVDKDMQRMGISIKEANELLRRAKRNGAEVTLYDFTEFFLQPPSKHWILFMQNWLNHQHRAFWWSQRSIAEQYKSNSAYNIIGRAEIELQERGFIEVVKPTRKRFTYPTRKLLPNTHQYWDRMGVSIRIPEDKLPIARNKLRDESYRLKRAMANNAENRQVISISRVTLHSRVSLTDKHFLRHERLAARIATPRTKTNANETLRMLNEQRNAGRMEGEKDALCHTGVA